jgi:hypothetical protein
MSVYIYAITGRNHPLDLEGLRGVGEPPHPPRAVFGDGLVAVVSDAPDDLRPKRRDLGAHQDVQERLLAGGAALPLRFGLVAADDAAVEAELTENAQRYGEQLPRLEGRVELNLKVSEKEEDALREVLRQSEEARRLNEEIREGRAAPDSSLALGELVAGLVRERQERLAGDVVASLRPSAVDVFVADPLGEDFLNASFLVEQAKAEEFAQAERKLADTYGDAFDFRLRGPLPPYSFV